MVPAGISQLLMEWAFFLSKSRLGFASRVFHPQILHFAPEERLDEGLRQNRDGLRHQELAGGRMRLEKVGEKSARPRRAALPSSPA